MASCFFEVPTISDSPVEGLQSTEHESLLLGERHPAGVPQDTISRIVLEGRFSITGSTSLFQYFLSSTNRPSNIAAIVENDRLTVAVSGFGNEGTDLAHAMREALADIRRYLGLIAEEFRDQNAKLEVFGVDLIRRRRRNLEAAHAAADEFRVPLERWPSDEALVTVPLERRSIILRPDEPDTYLGDREYKGILFLLLDGAIALERSPRAFSGMSEEQLRDILLVILNSHFRGLAMGEAFQRKGKTDIFIPYRDGNPFVGECKLWKGPRAAAAALEQLLGYLTFRTTKATLIVFSDNRDFAHVRRKLRDTVARHRCFRRWLSWDDERLRRAEVPVCELEHKARRLTLALLAVDRSVDTG